MSFHTQSQREHFGTALRKSPIKVLVGKDREAYYVHSDILSSCESSTTHIRMNGPWKAVGDEDVDWSDFDKETIECVLQYLYTGDYYVPTTPEDMQDYHRRGDEADLERLRGFGAQKDYETASTSAAEQTPQSPDERLRPLTPIDQCLGIGVPDDLYETAAGAISGMGLPEDDGVVGTSLLVHAKVYSFAHCNFFSELANFSLQRLTQILVIAPCTCDSLFPYLADAVRLIYNSTLKREGGEDPARFLLSQYIALNYTDLMGEELKSLADEGGEFMIDVNSKLARRLAASQQKARSIKHLVEEITKRVNTLETEKKHSQQKLQRYKDELRGWENWNKQVPQRLRRKQSLSPTPIDEW